jgi:hypothetical protein
VPDTERWRIDLNDLQPSGLCRGVDHETDLHELLQSYRLAEPPADRRSMVRSAARRRRWGQRAGAVGAVGSGLALVLVLASIGGRSGGAPVTAGPARVAAERVEQVPGLEDPVRLSTTLQPVLGTRGFGAVPLARGAITGATQTTFNDGFGPVTVLLAVTPGPDTARIEVTGDGLVAPVHRELDGPTLLVIELPTKDPHLVLGVAAVGGDGAVVGTARITPFSQDPLDCHNLIESTGLDSAGPEGEISPTYIAWLDAHLTAPVLPACDG